MKMFRTLGIALLTMACCSIVLAQVPAASWTKLANQPTFQTDSAILLTDGTVMMHQYNSGNWWRLTPSNTASYAAGTWTQLASMPAGYAPLYFAAAVLPDGRVLIEGGEYNNLIQNETNKGAIYDPVANTWTSVTPPTGWSTIGDSPAVVLPDGTFMMGQGGQPSKKQVLFNASTLTWTSVNSATKADGFSEEGFALTSNGDVLVVDTEDGTNSELYNPTTETWSSAGSTIVSLPNSGGLGIVPEMGPLVQRPDGSIVAFGATTHNAIYSPSTGTWAKASDYPSGDDMADGPATILPDGNILVYTSPGVFAGTGKFYEFTFATNTFVAAPSTAKGGNLQSWQGRTLLLPTGQVMWCAADGATIDVELYNSPGSVSASWRPVITSVPTTVNRGTTYTISGTQFNGFSVGSAYGDDVQSGSSYPLVVVRNSTTHHIFFGRTSNFSTSGIATGSTVENANFVIPSGAETGASTLFVVTNGILSGGKAVTIN